MESSPEYLIALYEFVQSLPWWLTYPTVSVCVFAFGPVAGGVFGIGVAVGGLLFWPTLAAYVGGAIVRDIGFCYGVYYGTKRGSWLRQQWLFRQFLASILRRVRVHSWRGSRLSYYKLLIISRFFKPPYVPLGVIATGVIMKKSLKTITKIIVSTQLIFSTLVLLLAANPITRPYLIAFLENIEVYFALVGTLYLVYRLDRSQAAGLRIWRFFTTATRAF